MRLFILCLMLLSIRLNAQYASSDFILTNDGLSEEYYSRFQSKVEVLVQAINSMHITEVIKPVIIRVGVSDEKGYIHAIGKFDYNRIFSPGEDYYQHNAGMQRQFGDGVSVYLQDEIMSALGFYLKSVAEKEGGFLLENAILKFESLVSLQKRNRDIFTVFAYNVYDNSGFYSHHFYTTATVKIGSKQYETEASPQLLNDYKYLSLGTTTGLDGRKNGAYYVKEFHTATDSEPMIEPKAKTVKKTTSSTGHPKYVYPEKKEK